LGRVTSASEKGVRAGFIRSVSAAAAVGPRFTSDKTKDGIASAASPLLSSLFVERVAAAANHSPQNDDIETEVETATHRLRSRKYAARLHGDSFKCLAR